MQKLLILLFCFLNINAPVIAQPAADCHVQLFTTDNGLPSNGIKDLQWDEKTEFLWMATEAGIVRFNGVDFKSYTRENMPAISSERMLFMNRNNAGRMYTSDQQGNIFFIDKSKPVLWRRAAVSNSVNPYVRNYYLLGVSDIFFKKNANSLNPHMFSSASDKIVGISDTSCIILKGGKLYYCSVNLADPVILPFEKENITAFFKIGNSYFITTNQKETFRFNIIDYTLTPVTIIEAAGSLFFPKTGNSKLYWQTGMPNPVFIDGEKAWLLTYEDNKIKATLIFTGIPADSYIKSVQYSQKNGLLFIGTESKGLIVINQNRVQSKRRNNINSKNRNSYYSQIELPDGNILTNESDIIGNNIAEENTLPIKGKFSFNVSVTNENLLWYSQSNARVGYNCLHQYNMVTGNTKVFPKIKWGDIVTSSGSKIYLTNPYGIGMIDGDSLLFLHKFAKNLAGTVIFDFAEISPGILAVATCNGLLRFNTTTHRLDTIFTKENICVPVRLISELRT